MKIQPLQDQLMVEGMQLDRGDLSPYFVRDPERMEVLLDNPVMLIHEKKISDVKDLLTVLEEADKALQPLLLLAEDLEGDVLATLMVNKLRGTLQLAVKAPRYDGSLLDQSAEMEARWQAWRARGVVHDRRMERGLLAAFSGVVVAAAILLGFVGS